jgi:hypothetical protein
MFLKKDLLKIFILFFTACLLFSVVYVAFDQHLIAPSKTCTLCSFNKSLSSAINLFPVIIEIDLNNIYIFWIDKIIYFEGLTFYPNISYRGPPHRGISL